LPFVQYIRYSVNRGYWMSVKFNTCNTDFMNDLNKIIICEPLLSISIILFKKFNKLSNELKQILYSIYHIPKIKTVWSEKNNCSLMRL
jgi:hypothetical protein